jgi:hypothetical protein
MYIFGPSQLPLDGCPWDFTPAITDISCRKYSGLFLCLCKSSRTVLPAICGKGDGNTIFKKKGWRRRVIQASRRHERSVCGLETNRFLIIVKEEGIRRRAICSVCLQAKDRTEAVKSAIVSNSSLNSNVAPHTGSLQRMSIFLWSKTGYVKINALSQVYLGSYRRDFSENPREYPNFICWNLPFTV